MLVDYGSRDKLLRLFSRFRNEMSRMLTHEPCRWSSWSSASDMQQSD